MSRRPRYRIEFEGRDGPEPGVPNDRPWLVRDVLTDDVVFHVSTRRECAEWVRQQPDRYLRAGGED